MSPKKIKDEIEQIAFDKGHAEGYAKGKVEGNNQAIKLAEDKFNAVLDQALDISTNPYKGWCIMSGQADGLINGVRMVKTLWEEGSLKVEEAWQVNKNVEKMKLAMRPGLLKFLK